MSLLGKKPMYTNQKKPHTYLPCYNKIKALHLVSNVLHTYVRASSGLDTHTRDVRNNTQFGRIDILH